MKIVNNTHVSHCIFSYDVLPQLSHIRLVCANGNWHGNNTLHYETSMEYEKNGRISRKVLYADTWLNGVYSWKHFDEKYHYDTTYQPNTVRMINGSHNHYINWDAKGNLVHHHNEYAGYDRHLCWDEHNRLQGVMDKGQHLSYYQYDAAGDRTYKFTGEHVSQNIGGQWYQFYNVDRPTLYASPYLVANMQGYTKHYYAENERVASRIGGGGFQDLPFGYEENIDLVNKHKESSINLFGRVTECLKAKVQPLCNALAYLCEWQEIRNEEPDCYWYHPDHLGSSSWITHADGTAVQHLHYLPFGEDFVNQRTSDFSARYTFSAKEKDAETGYSYFGSRYYNSDLSIWLSVDPMASKYPSLSPYVYCANNPVMLVDPNGEEVDWVERTVNGKKEVYYDRSVKSQADVDNKYGKNSGVRHLADGSKVGNGQYTVYNDHQDNINGVVKDANGTTINPDRTIIYGKDYTLFAGMTDASVNAETLRKNMFGSSYIGPNNPKDYNEDDNYDYKPIWSPTEMAAYRHDKAYDFVGAKGLVGALLNQQTKCADLYLIEECRTIAKDPKMSASERSRARKIAFGFSCIDFIFKTPRF